MPSTPFKRRRGKGSKGQSLPVRMGLFAMGAGCAVLFGFMSSNGIGFNPDEGGAIVEGQVGMSAWDGGKASYRRVLAEITDPNDPDYDQCKDSQDYYDQNPSCLGYGGWFFLQIEIYPISPFAGVSVDEPAFYFF